MNDLRVFRHEEFGEIRTVMIEDEPWFVGKDIAVALGYAKPENAIANHVDNEDKTSTLIQGNGSNYKSRAIIINESGMYSLIFSSKMPNVKGFKRWIMNNVMPTLRRNNSEILTENPINNAIYAPKMNELEVFQYENQDVRMVMIDDAPWWVLADICKVLDLANPTHVANRLDDNEKQRLKFNPTSDVGLGHNGATIVNESGLYKVILRSDKPEAKKFTNWVTQEVLPSIRKRGAYMTPETIEKILYNPDLIIKIATDLKNERQQKIELQNQIEADRPKVEFANAVAESDTTILIGELAKILKQNGVDMGERRLYEWMRQNGYLIQRDGSDQNMPTQRAMDMGLFTIRESIIRLSDNKKFIAKTTRVTGKGQQYFINKFIQKRKSGQQTDPTQITAEGNILVFAPEPEVVFTTEEE